MTGPRPLGARDGDVWVHVLIVVAIIAIIAALVLVVAADIHEAATAATVVGGAVTSIGIPCAIVRSGVGLVGRPAFPGWRAPPDTASPDATAAAVRHVVLRIHSAACPDAAPRGCAASLQRQSTDVGQLVTCGMRDDPERCLVRCGRQRAGAARDAPVSGSSLRVTPSASRNETADGSPLLSLCDCQALRAACAAAWLVLISRLNLLLWPVRWGRMWDSMTPHAGPSVM